ncbi:hypothetical protein OC846_003109 [Tilletia horrida]|uniref:Uncharacterized protein n=1 Tax=Tilletia horrida TaxID=155126 RepID=A0AAN6GPN5_9BASI|nr:hypothetical protein OC845_001995 [Tilletia horrida]KAK0551928.1 hypothetical protein OC846_003109 [Tilletia horrida]KAK0568653.1 hypothetical protein OC861_001730 [Tilletia horrida]
MAPKQASVVRSASGKSIAEDATDGQKDRRRASARISSRPSSSTGQRHSATADYDDKVIEQDGGQQQGNDVSPDSEKPSSSKSKARSSQASTSETEGTASKAMPPPALPPQTPTRALLNRIRRRSHINGTSGGSIPPLPSAQPFPSLLVTRSSGAPPLDIATEDEQAALEKQVDDLLEAGESKDKIIADLKKANAELRAEVKLQKQLVEEIKSSNKKRLNEQTLSNLEQEFHQQENILQGLQRDNEEKTIEIERVKRKGKLLTEYLHKLHGDDWAAVVVAAVGGASILPSSQSLASLPLKVGEAEDFSVFSNSAVARAFAGAGSGRSVNTSNLERALVQAASTKAASAPVVAGAPTSYGTAMPPSSPVKKRLVREAHLSTSPTKAGYGDGGSNWGDSSFVSAVDVSTLLPSATNAGGVAGDRANHFSDLDAVQEDQDDTRSSQIEAAPSSDPAFASPLAEPLLPSSGASRASDAVLPSGISVAQLDIMRASIESTRLLVQGYLRSDATRRTKLDQMLEVAEHRTKEFEGVISAH